ncbi:VanW family protein [Streptomyces kronopolitis]|uniref:VanW family protein n=1 Tax=Streptomyces kronopolitis TaxID=1612435 RepID=UPI00341F9566
MLALPRPFLITGAAAAAGFGGLYVVGLLVAGDDVAPGTRVRGVDIGGVSREEAARTLADAFTRDGRGSAPLQLKIGEATQRVAAASLGVGYDHAATAARAARSGSDPVTVIGRLLTSPDKDVTPVIKLDEARARAGLDGLASTTNRRVREGAIDFRAGRPKITQPRAGQALDVEASLAALRGSDPTAPAPQPVRLPVKKQLPRTGVQEVKQALSEFAGPALSSPITLTTGGRRVLISTAILSKHLKAEADTKGTLRPKLDAKQLLLDPAVARPLAEITGKPAEPRVGLRNGKAIIESEGKAGKKVTPEAVSKAVLPLLTKPVGQRTGRVDSKVTQPKISARSISKLGIKEQMSTFTVSFEPAEYRTKNIGRAAELINGSVVMPDETWSFNRTVGERTKQNGFVDGTIINNGQFEKASGGGVSAVATTVFNALFFAGVKPVEHRAHSFYIERYPEGREATVAWGSLDLKFNNDSGNAIYIQTKATKSSITVTFLGTKKYDAVKGAKGPRTNLKKPATRSGGNNGSCEPQSPLEGFTVTNDRIFLQSGKEVKREAFTTNYTPRDAVACN